MIYYNDVLCVSGAELIRTNKNPTGLISKGVWSKWISGGAKVLRRACLGNPSLIKFDTIPVKYQKIISAKYGIYPKEYVYKSFQEKIITDTKAIEFYNSYLFSNGCHISELVQNKYTINASLLNAIKEIITNATIYKKALGGNTKGIWATASKTVNDIRTEIKHTLPKHPRPLKRKYDTYLNEGYEALISKKYCNNNSLKKDK